MSFNLLLFESGSCQALGRYCLRSLISDTLNSSSTSTYYPFLINTVLLSTGDQNAASIPSVQPSGTQVLSLLTLLKGCRDSLWLNAKTILPVKRYSRILPPFSSRNMQSSTWPNVMPNSKSVFLAVFGSEFLSLFDH